MKIIIDTKNNSIEIDSRELTVREVEKELDKLFKGDSWKDYKLVNNRVPYITSGFSNWDNSISSGNMTLTGTNNYSGHNPSSFTTNSSSSTSGSDISSNYTMGTSYLNKESSKELNGDIAKTIK